jgi:hypothetical protein
MSVKEDQNGKEAVRTHIDQSFRSIQSPLITKKRSRGNVFSRAAFSRAAFSRAAFIEVNGAPVELLQYL